MNLKNELSYATDCSHALLTVFGYSDTSETMAKVLLLALQGTDTSVLHLDERELKFLDGGTLRNLIIILAYSVRNKKAVDEVICQTLLAELTKQYLSDQ